MVIRSWYNTMNSQNNNPRLAAEQFTYLLEEGTDNDPPPKIPHYIGTIHYKQDKLPMKEKEIIEYVATAALLGTGQVGFDPIKSTMVMFLQVWDIDRRRCAALEDIEAVWITVDSDGSM